MFRLFNFRRCRWLTGFGLILFFGELSTFIGQENDPDKSDEVPNQHTQLNWGKEK